MTATTRSTDPIVLLDVDDLAEADLEADLAERLELDGWVLLRPDGPGGGAVRWCGRSERRDVRRLRPLLTLLDVERDALPLVE